MIHTHDFSDGKIYAIIWVWTFILSPKPDTLDEKKDRADVDGVGPLGRKVVEEPKDLRWGKDNFEKEAVKQTLE